MYQCIKTTKASDGKFYSVGRKIDDADYNKLSEESKGHFKQVTVQKSAPKASPAAKPKAEKAADGSKGGNDNDSDAKG